VYATRRQDALGRNREWNLLTPPVATGELMTNHICYNDYHCHAFCEKWHEIIVAAGPHANSGAV